MGTCELQLSHHRVNFIKKTLQMAIKQYDFSECLQFIVEVGRRNFGSIMQAFRNMLAMFYRVIRSVQQIKQASVTSFY